MSGPGICVHMNGALCAMQYCDYYNYDQQKCSLAIESQARAEVAMKLLEKLEELLADAKDEDSVKKIIKELNVVFGPKTLQQFFTGITYNNTSFKRRADMRWAPGAQVLDSARPMTCLLLCVAK